MAIILVLATTAIITIIVKLLSKKTTHTVYTAELTGVTLALELTTDKPY